MKNEEKSINLTDLVNKTIRKSASSQIGKSVSNILDQLISDLVYRECSKKPTRDIFLKMIRDEIEKNSKHLVQKALSKISVEVYGR